MATCVPTEVETSSALAIFLDHALSTKYVLAERIPSIKIICEQEVIHQIEESKVSNYKDSVLHRIMTSDMKEASGRTFEINTGNGLFNAENVKLLFMMMELGSCVFTCATKYHLQPLMVCPLLAHYLGLSPDIVTEAVDSLPIQAIIADSINPNFLIQLSLEISSILAVGEARYDTAFRRLQKLLMGSLAAIYVYNLYSAVDSPITQHKMKNDVYDESFELDEDEESDEFSWLESSAEKQSAREELRYSALCTLSVGAMVELIESLAVVHSERCLEQPGAAMSSVCMGPDQFKIAQLRLLLEFCLAQGRERLTEQVYKESMTSNTLWSAISHHDSQCILVSLPDRKIPMINDRLKNSATLVIAEHANTCKVTRKDSRSRSVDFSTYLNFIVWMRQTGVLMLYPFLVPRVAGVLHGVSTRAFSPAQNLRLLMVGVVGISPEPSNRHAKICANMGAKNTLNA